MSNKVKDIDIKNRTFYFLTDVINTEKFNSNNIKIDEKSYKNILLYYIGYITIKEYIQICSVNHLYLSFRNLNGYF